MARTSKDVLRFLPPPLSTSQAGFWHPLGML